MLVKYSAAFVLYSLMLCSCAKKNLNLPDTSPMPIKTGPESVVVANCSSRFSAHMSFAEIAGVAASMRLGCGFTQEQVLNSAQKTFK